MFAAKQGPVLAGPEMGSGSLNPAIVQPGGNLKWVARRSQVGKTKENP